MLELRIVLVPKYRIDGESVVEVERVLQYRIEKGPSGGQWWGEWKDVPVVHLEDLDG